MTDAVMLISLLIIVQVYIYIYVYIYRPQCIEMQNFISIAHVGCVAQW